VQTSSTTVPAFRPDSHSGNRTRSQVPLTLFSISGLHLSLGMASLTNESITTGRPFLFPFSRQKSRLIVASLAQVAWNGVALEPVHPRHWLGLYVLSQQLPQGSGYRLEVTILEMVNRSANQSLEGKRERTPSMSASIPAIWAACLLEAKACCMSGISEGSVGIDCPDKDAQTKAHSLPATNASGGKSNR